MALNLGKARSDQSVQEFGAAQAMRKNSIRLFNFIPLMCVVYATGLTEDDMNKAQIGISPIWWEGIVELLLFLVAL